MEYVVLPIRLKKHEADHLRTLASAHGMKSSTFAKFLIARSRLPKGFQSKTKTVAVSKEPATA